MCLAIRHFNIPLCLSQVMDDSRKWWKARNMRGQIAHVPHTIVTPYPSMEDDVFNNPVYGSTARSNRENYYTTVSRGL